MAGFLGDMTVAPDDGIGVVVLGNTGGLTTLAGCARRRRRGETQTVLGMCPAKTTRITL